MALRRNRATLNNPGNPNPGNNSTPAATPQTPGLADRGEMNNSRERRGETPRRNESRPTETAQQPVVVPGTSSPGTASPETGSPETPRNRSLILRGGNRTTPSNSERETAAANPNPVRNQNQNGGNRAQSSRRSHRKRRRRPLPRRIIRCLLKTGVRSCPRDSRLRSLRRCRNLGARRQFQIRGSR